MKKFYMTPEMEILDTELEGFLAASNGLNAVYEPGKNMDFDARLGGGDFDDFDDFEEDEY